MAATSSYISAKPTAISHGPVNIDHPQLRDLAVCPHEQGLVTYVKESEIVEQNLNLPNAPIRTLADLAFTPSSVTALALGPDDSHTLIAACGSWNADLHLSYHQPEGAEAAWKYNCRLSGNLNNSTVLTRANASSAEPRVGVTNNDRTFRLYDCALRRQPLTPRRFDPDDILDGEEHDPGRLECVGSLKLDTCANYASLSPSGRMILSVGDSPNAYLHHIGGSSRVDFYPIAVIPLPLPTNTPPQYPTSRPSSFTASFATAWSKDGSKYAVGSQEGVVAVWDIRSTKKHLKVFQVDKMREMDTGHVSWDPSHWFGSTAPAWSVRNVKFGGDQNGVNETLVFTEHTSLVHIVDAKTFEHEEIIRVPSHLREPEPPSPPMHFSSSPLPSPLSLIQLELPPLAVSVPTNTYQFSLPPLLASPAHAILSTSSRATNHESPAVAEDSELTRDGFATFTTDADADVTMPDTTAEVPSQISPPLASTSTRPLRLPKSVLSNGVFFSEPEFEYKDDTDIAGLCFDPTGRWMYVGTEEGIVEWEMIDRSGMRVRSPGTGW